MDDFRYLLGKFEISGDPNTEDRKALIGSLHQIPDQLRGTVCDLAQDQLDTSYREVFLI
jgi:hypothetical protein